MNTEQKHELEQTANELVYDRIKFGRTLWNGLENQEIDALSEEIARRVLVFVDQLVEIEEAKLVEVMR
jgi:hypothetical protein